MIFIYNDSCSDLDLLNVFLVKFQKTKYDGFSLEWVEFILLKGVRMFLQDYFFFKF